MSRRARITLVAVLLVGALSPALAQKYATGDAVVAAMDARPTPAAMVSTMTMTITTASGQRLTREMQIWSAAGGDRELVKFTAPADIKGSGFLSVKAADGSMQSLVYLPALDRVRRIAGSQKQESFFGSDFSYEDITDLQGGAHADYDNVLVEVKPGPVYVVRSTAKPGAGAAYDQLVMEVPEATLLPRRVAFYRSGTLLKVMTIGATARVDGYVLPSRLSMHTEAGGTTTTIEQRDIQVEETLPDEIFTERFLRR